jgi:hypothetical protein
MLSAFFRRAFGRWHSSAPNLRRGGGLARDGLGVKQCWDAGGRCHGDDHNGEPVSGEHWCRSPDVMI